MRSNHLINKITMKIGIVSTVGGYSWAGSEEMWKLMAVEALKEGDSVAAFLQYPISESEELDDFRAGGGVIFPYQSLNWIQRRLSEKGWYSRFQSVDRWKPDVLCISLGVPCDLFAQRDILALAQRMNVPQVYILQCNAEAILKGDQMRRALLPLYRNAARIICVSEGNREMLQRQLATDLPNAVVIANPIRERLEEPLAWPDESRGIRFATVARYETECKAQDLILKTLSSQLWKGRDWHYNLFGGGPDESYLRDLIRYYGLEEKVAIRGYERDLKKIWGEHHLHLLVSRAEGLTLALEESMCCGRPALINHAGGNHELVRDGIDGFLSPGLDSDSLNKTLEMAWSRKNEWNQMGISAHERVKNWVPEELGKHLVATIKNSLK